MPNPEKRDDIKKQTTMFGTTPSLGTGVATLTLGVDLEPGGVGARHPSNKPNTRGTLEKDGKKRIGVATGRATPNFVLTSYAAWWHRMEKEASQFYKDVRDEEEKRKRKMEEKKKKQKQKEEFIKKFFPSCGNSPGGTW